MIRKYFEICWIASGTIRYAYMIIISGLIFNVSCAVKEPVSEDDYPELLIPINAEEVGEVKLDILEGPEVLSRSYFHLNYYLLNQSIERLRSGGEGLKFKINVGNESMLAIIQRVVSNSLNNYSWFGKIQGIPESELIIVGNDANIAGSIGFDNNFYNIIYVKDDVYAVIKFDPNALPEGGEPLEVPDASNNHSKNLHQMMMHDCLESIQIDVYAYYTNDVVKEIGDENAVKNLIQMAIDLANKAYERSGVSQRLFLLFAEKLKGDYSENGLASSHLKKIRLPSDNQLDYIHEDRYLTQADLVTVFFRRLREKKNNEIIPIAGKAHTMQTVSTEFSTRAFSIVTMRAAIGNMSLAHELGHNMGLAHDRRTAQRSGAFGAFSYSFGYWKPQKFRTVMSYNCPTSDCGRIPYFSNPRVSYEGDPTGISEVNTNSADNAKALNESGCTVSKFGENLPSK